MSYESVIKPAAEQRMGGDSTGAWALADALVAEVPDEGRGGDRRQSSDVTTLLADIAERLEADGIETPRGDAYSAASLRDLRLVAMGWPPEARLAEAAFRTHQEAGTADARKRAVLAALCQAARARRWTRPTLEGLPKAQQLDEDAWAKAAASIRRKVASKTRYPASANDLRIALHRRPNVPASPPPADQATMLDAIEWLQEATEGIEYAVKVLCNHGGPSDTARDVLVALAQRLDAGAQAIRELLAGGGLSDAALESFLEENQA